MIGRLGQRPQGLPADAGTPLPQLAGQVGDQDLDVGRLGTARASALSASRLASRDRVAATAADVSTSALEYHGDIVQLPTDMSHLAVTLTR